MTDTGHEGGSGSFALGHPEKLIDFGYRSTHEMTVKAKAIIAAYYGQRSEASLFQRLLGRRQAGIDGGAAVSRAITTASSPGAPGNNWTHMMAQIVWVAQAVHKDEASYIPPSEISRDSRCRAGGVRRPRRRQGWRDRRSHQVQVRSQGDPMQGEDGPSCLTAPQVEAARKIYSAAKNPRTKQEIYPGFEPGSELGWGQFVAGPRPLLSPPTCLSLWCSRTRIGIIRR